MLLLNMNRILSTDVFVFVIINGNKHVQTYGKSRNQNFLQGSEVTQTMLSGLTIYPPVANFLQCMCAKNCENWLALAVDKVMAKISRLTFLAHPVFSFNFFWWTP